MKRKSSKTRKIDKKKVEILEIAAAIIVALLLFFIIIGKSKETYYPPYTSYSKLSPQPSLGGGAVAGISPGIFGDVNLDSDVTFDDYYLLLNYLSGNEMIETNALAYNDLDMDGKVDFSDSKILLDYLIVKVGRLPVLFGDVSLDNILDKDDAVLLQGFVEGHESLSGEQFYRADVNSDEIVDKQDTLILLGKI